MRERFRRPAHADLIVTYNYLIHEQAEKSFPKPGIFASQGFAKRDEALTDVDMTDPAIRPVPPSAPKPADADKVVMPDASRRLRLPQNRPGDVVRTVQYFAELLDRQIAEFCYRQRRIYGEAELSPPLEN